MARAAAALAGIDAAIRALPEGYDTVCTEGIFSQGEWQLLSIARAAAADPATSSFWEDCTGKLMRADLAEKIVIL